MSRDSVSEPAMRHVARALARVAAGWSLALSSQAAAPVYFDLAGLLGAALLYLIGIAVLTWILAATKYKVTWSLVLATYVFGPVAYCSHEGAARQAQNAEVLDAMRVGEANNARAFAAYCKDRNRVVNARVAADRASSLLIRQEAAFTGVGWRYNAYPVHEYLTKNSQRCEATGLGFLEGLYDGAYVAERKGYEREVRSYKLCTSEKWQVATTTNSRYELILGEASEKKPVPWGGEANWMSKSSVRLVDTKTGATLAQDTMYFLRYESGEGGCPEGLEQLTSLIADVFPKGDGVLR